MPLLRRWRRALPLPDPAVAEAEVTALRPEPEPTEAEVLLADFDPAALNANGQAQPWSPQPRETAQEYAAFQAWLLADTKCPIHPLAQRRGWETRKVATKAMGADLELVAPAVLQKVSAQCVQLALQWGLNEMSKHLHASQSAEHPSATVKDTVAIVKDVAMLARLLHGLSTENVSVRDGSAEDFSLLTDEQLVQYMQLQALTKGSKNEV
jgi:hypothetical protein